MRFRQVTANGATEQQLRDIVAKAEAQLKQGKPVEDVKYMVQILKSKLLRSLRVVEA